MLLAFLEQLPGGSEPKKSQQYPEAFHTPKVLQPLNDLAEFGTHVAPNIVERSFKRGYGSRDVGLEICLAFYLA
jgi:hypothetical protein